jgi:hypothetical protein
MILLLQPTSVDDFDVLSGTGGVELSMIPLLVIIALCLGFAAQGWINQQLNGDQGLGAFLKDGKGYQNSAFRPFTDGDRAASTENDPLPWLALPKLDFVEVAGQDKENDADKNNKDDNDAAIFAQLDELRILMNQQLQQGNVVEASAIRRKLESLMRENGIEFQPDP